MAGLGIRLYTDENVDPRLAKALRDRDYDAESCQEAKKDNRRIPDEQQLAHAAAQGRAILTFNAGDYLQLDRDWKAASRQHAGMIVSPEIRNVGELLRRAQRRLGTVEPAVQHDTLLWLV